MALSKHGCKFWIKLHLLKQHKSIVFFKSTYLPWSASSSLDHNRCSFKLTASCLLPITTTFMMHISTSFNLFWNFQWSCQLYLCCSEKHNNMCTKHHKIQTLQYGTSENKNYTGVSPLFSENIGKISIFLVLALKPTSTNQSVLTNTWHVKSCKVKKTKFTK